MKVLFVDCICEGDPLVQSRDFEDESLIKIWSLLIVPGNDLAEDIVL
jgi:hypothetical protein